MNAATRPGRPGLALVYPTLMLGVLFVVPFGIMVAVSFFPRVEGGFYEPGFVLRHYARFFTSFFSDHLAFSLGISALSAAISVAVAFPFTYALTRLARRRQVPVLVFLLAILSLSEVIVGFSWSVLLSKTAGVSNILVWLGLFEAPVAWTPGFGAVLCGLCYLALPYTVLVLYPSLARLDREVVEAARTMGAAPLRTFTSVVVPLQRQAIVAALILVFVFNLGAYLTPQILGRPQHWTLSVLITDQAVYQANVPFSAAMAIFLALVGLGLVGVVAVLARRRRV
jgi:putative spermidine/putrescine transport system permease protein